jgi:2-polyprenyl-6-methoxyphenol hydroxylase-like FAD-dependent oxidoreductase
MTPLLGKEGKQFVLERMGRLSEDFKAIVQATQANDILQTDVFDSQPFACTSQHRVVLIGDAAHPVVHHFGQGACLAIEDAVRLAQCLALEAQGQALTRDRLEKALAAFNAPWARARAWGLMYISRWCGDLYMGNTWLHNAVLELCLSWPLRLVATAVMRHLLFSAQRDLRGFSRRQLQAGRGDTAPTAAAGPAFDSDGFLA